MDNINVVLDISSIIWNEKNYNRYTPEYYDLAKSILLLFDKLEKENPKILISSELLEQMMADFPYGKIKDYYFERQAMEFLSKINTTEYSDFIIPNIVSHPNLIKSYFKPATKDEVLYLISEMHSNDETESKYFTFNYLWNGNDQLKTEAEYKTNTYETIIADNGNDLDDFFDKFKLIFKHKTPKHDCSFNKNRDAWNNSNDKGNFPSQLSCYCDENDEIVQDILNKRHKKCFENKYYSYDDINDVYVVFRITLNNVYHAHDMYAIEKVPQEVKKQFNIWKY